MESLTPMRESLGDGQVVTLLVGLGLQLRDLHRAGEAFGPLHPVHVAIDDGGRPRLLRAVVPPTWTPHDDWVALLRLGRVMGCGPRAASLTWQATGRREGPELLRWLMAWATPQPLPAAASESGQAAVRSA